MVLEALAAVSLASNIVQFVHFLCQLLAEIGEVTSSTAGITEHNSNIESTANDLARLSRYLNSASTTTGSPLVKEMKSLSQEITLVADDLLNEVTKLKTTKPRGTLKGFGHVLGHKFGKSQKIEKIASKLGRLQAQLNTQLLVMLTDQDSEVFQALQRLIDESKLMHTNTTVKLETIESEIIANIAALDSKTRLYGSKVEDVLRSLSRLESIHEKNISELMERFTKLTSTLNQIQTEVRTAVKHQNFLRSLHFKLIRMRESKIPHAHTETFEWMFAADNDEVKFLDWLQYSTGVFWVMGKAGSGKSTLMKFLVHHEHTQHHLEAWSRGTTLVVASFYFWSAGHELQKSLEGLFRSLLFEILRKCPEMIESLLRSMSDHFVIDDIEAIWTTEGLLQAFEHLERQAQSSTSFCFFIDGLDEFDGDTTVLVKALRLLSGVPRVKLCVSSRPWHIFKDEYGCDNSAMLKLEDLTRSDISCFVKDTLESHERFGILCQQDPRYASLVKQIVDKAEGVFLWVFLVVQSLLRGLTSADRMSDLQKRIALIPPSLEEFFRHMLDSIEDVYRKDTFKAFQYVLLAPPSGPIPLAVFSYLDEEDPVFAFNCGNQELSAVEIKSREEIMRRRIDGRTKGLLEASVSVEDGVPTVDFLHRTARDFLLTRDMHEMLQENLDADFNAERLLCLSFLAQMQLGPIHALSDPFVNVLHYAHELETKRQCCEYEILEYMEGLVGSPLSPWSASVKADGNFTGTSIRNNLKLFVTKRLDATSSERKKSKTPMLHVCLSNIRSRGPQQYLNPEMAMLLLDNGAKPNQNLNFSSTVWTEFMAKVYRHYSETPRDAVIQTIAALVSHGADLAIPVQIREIESDPGHAGLNSNCFRDAVEIIQERYPQDAEWLINKSRAQTAARRSWWSLLKSS